MKIISVGAAVQDVFLSHSDEFKAVCHNPEECFMELKLGAKADVNKIVFSTGGGATNAAVTFARQGIESQFMGIIGDDPAGVAVLRDLDKEGVDTQYVAKSEEYNTGYSVLLLAPNGERTILTYRGASTHYNSDDFHIDGGEGDWVYISTLAGNMKLLDNICYTAKQRGLKIFFNPGKKELSQPEKLKGILTDIDVLLVNKEEAKMIVDGETSIELIKNLQNFVPTVIISDGPNGVIAGFEDQILEAGMYEDVPVRDRTGAGDAFGSGFLSQWSQGKSLRESLIFASANSTSVVQYIGAKEGILHSGAQLHDMDVKEIKL